MVQPMYERRRLPRHEVVKSVKIMLNDESCAIDCTVCNLTSDGACLQFPAVTCAANSFQFSFDNFRSMRACYVVWRRADKIGLYFE
jgi:hypothetical protein